MRLFCVVVVVVVVVYKYLNMTENTKKKKYLKNDTINNFQNIQNKIASNGNSFVFRFNE